MNDDVRRLMEENLQTNQEILKFIKKMHHGFVFARVVKMFFILSIFAATALGAMAIMPLLSSFTGGGDSMSFQNITQQFEALSQVLGGIEQGETAVDPATVDALQQGLETIQNGQTNGSMEDLQQTVTVEMMEQLQSIADQQDSSGTPQTGVPRS